MSAPVELPLAGYARTGRRQGAAWPWALSGIGLGLAVLAAGFHSTALDMIALWRTSPTYAYAWAVLPSLVYVLWHHRRRFAGVPPAPSIAGIVATVGCGLAWLAADLANLAIGREAAFVAATIALVLAATGWAVFRRLLPFLALLLLLVPAGDLLTPPLKWLTVHTIAAASTLATIPHSIDGNVFYAGASRYVVIDDCAGLPVVLAFAFLALIFGLLVYRTAWKIALFALVGTACGIAANSLRVISIVGVDRVTGTQMNLASHAYFEWVALALALGVLFAVLTRVTPETSSRDGSGAAPAGGGAGWRCLVTASGAAMLAASIPHGVLRHIARNDAPAVLRPASVVLPQHLAQWRRQGQSDSWRPAPRVPLPHDAARYVAHERAIAVFVAATDAPGRKITGYSVDLAGPGAWRETKRGALDGCATDACRKVQVLELLRSDSPDVRRVFYVYVIDGAFAGSALALQLQLAWARLSGAHPEARLIALVSEEKTALRTEELLELLEALARRTWAVGRLRVARS